MTTAPAQDTKFYGDVAPETCLRIVDVTITEWLSGITLRNQKPRVTNVWQSRQFAQNHEMQDGQPTKQAKVWPVLSLSMTGISPALDRRVVAQISRLGMIDVPISDEILATGVGATASYSGRLGRLGIKHGSVRITAGILAVVDDGAGRLIGSVGVGENTINYDTGRYSVTFSGNVPTGVPVQVSYTTTDSKMYVDNQKDEVFILPFPLPFDLTYQIDLWTKTQQDMQSLRTNLLVRFPFTDETFLDMEIPGYGTQMLRLSLTRVDDNTDLEPGEADRELRNTFSITAHAWIYRIALKRKTIKGISIVFLDAGSDPAALIDGSEFLAWYSNSEHYIFSGTTPGVLQSVQESPILTPPDRAIMWLSWVGGTLTEVGP
jgi:hypothetical protein